MGRCTLDSGFRIHGGIEAISSTGRQNGNSVISQYHNAPRTSVSKGHNCRLFVLGLRAPLPHAAVLDILEATFKGIIASGRIDIDKSVFSQSPYAWV